MAASVAVKCPTCDGIVDIVTPTLGMHVECPDCEGLFVVSSCTPLELTHALDMEDEGWFAEDEQR